MAGSQAQTPLCEALCAASSSSEVLSARWLVCFNSLVVVRNRAISTVIRLKDAPKGYKDFDKGAAKKFVLDPNDMVAA